ncbi:MAG: LCP family protein [Eubacterium sp.]|nr:LCP family protein [Eubacterium sp.]
MKTFRLVGCILAGIQFILSAVLVYFLIRTHMIPQRYIVMGAIILGLLPICFIAMQLRKVPGIIASVLSVLICCVLVFGMIKVNQANKMLDEVTGNKTEIDVVNVYVGKDDPVDSINKAVQSGYIFGILNDNNDNVQKTINEINGSNPQAVKTENYPSIKEIIKSFEAGDIQGFIVSSGVLSVLDGEEQYKDYSKKLKIILENKIETVVQEKPKKKTEKKKDDNAMRFCAYISGIDTYGEVTLKSRSDVNVIAVINTKTNTVLLVSTPRDYYVNLAKDGEPLDKLTHAGIYGIDMSMSTLENLYDTDIDYYFRVNFTGFVDIIDIIGGVDVESDYAFSSHLDDSGYYYEKGTNHLSGEAALYFARERYSFNEGDRQRGKNQMAVIKAVMNKLLSSELLNNFSELMSEMKDCFQTNMEKAELGKLIQGQIDSGDSWNIVQYSVNGYDEMNYCYSLGDNAYVMPPYYDTVEYASELINKVLNDETLTQEQIDSNAPEH